MAFGFASNLGYAVVGFVLVLSLVVFFHELGHFLVGRWCGVKVDAFSLGFGPELAHYTDRRGTRWRLGALPLGGYVKFHGDLNAASQPSVGANTPPATLEGTTLAAQPVSRRAAIVAAGPIANFILAIAIFTGIFAFYGKAVLLPRIDGTMPGSAAEAAGFKSGDVISSIDGVRIDDFLDLKRIVSGASDRTLRFTVQRGGETLTVDAAPRRQDIESRFGPSREGILGVKPSSNPADWHTETFSLPQAFRLALNETWFIVERTGSYVGGLFAGRETSAQLSGPLRIAEVSGAMAQAGLGALLNLAAVLSVSIGLLNLVPIPVLDGGHLLYFVFEALRGRPLNERVQEYGFRVGIALVLGLMIFATFNDVVHLTRG